MIHRYLVFAGYQFPPSSSGGWKDLQGSYELSLDAFDQAEWLLTGADDNMSWYQVVDTQTMRIIRSRSL